MRAAGVVAAALFALVLCMAGVACGEERGSEAFQSSARLPRTVPRVRTMPGMYTHEHAVDAFLERQREQRSRARAMRMGAHMREDARQHTHHGGGSHGHGFVDAVGAARRDGGATEMEMRGSVCSESGRDTTLDAGETLLLRMNTTAANGSTEWRCQRTFSAAPQQCLHVDVVAVDTHGNHCHDLSLVLGASCAHDPWLTPTAFARRGAGVVGATLAMHGTLVGPYELTMRLTSVDGCAAELACEWHHECLGCTSVAGCAWSDGGGCVNATRDAVQRREPRECAEFAPTQEAMRQLRALAPSAPFGIEGPHAWCSPQSVECRDGVVTAIEMYGMSGAFPVEALQLLPALRSVTFGNSDFQSTSLPRSLAPWPHLRTISSFACQIGGMMPHTYVEEDSCLTNVLLGRNRIQGTVPRALFTTSPWLRSLFLGDNGLSGTVPDLFHLTPRLIELFLYTNKFYGTLPQSVSACRYLGVYTLSACRFTGTIPQGTATLPVLEEFYVAYNELVGTLPTLTSPHFTTISMENNRLHGDLPTAWNYPQLENLFLQNNEFTGEIPAAWGGLTNLAMLKCHNNRLHGTLPLLESLHLLTLFDASHNDLSGTVPGSLFSPPRMITYLMLQSNQLEALPAVPEDTTVYYLDVSHNVINSTWMWSLCNIQVVDISNNLIHGEMEEHGSDKTYRCRSLRASTNLLRGTVPVMDTFPFLTTLDLSFNAFTAWEASSQTHIEELNLSHNRLAIDVYRGWVGGPIALPYAFGDLRVLDISYNDFVPAPLPREWESLRQLHTLRVQYSGLTMTTVQADALPPGFVCERSDSVLAGMCYPDWLRLSDTTTSLASVGNEFMECYSVVAQPGRPELTVEWDDAFWAKRNCMCKRGHVLREVDGVRTCEPCAEHATCKGAEESRIVMPDDDWWASPNATHTVDVLPCRRLGVCHASLADDGRHVSACVDGYSGRLCSRCAPNHFRLGQACMTCGSDAAGYALVAASVVGIGAYIAYLFWKLDSRGVGSATLRILLFHLQMLRLVPKMGVALPSVLVGSSQSTAPFSLHLSGIECLDDRYDAEVAFWGTLSIPVVCAVVVGLVFLVASMMLNLNKQRWHFRCMSVFAFLLFTAYFVVTTSIFEVLPCEYDASVDAWYFTNVPYLHCAPTLPQSPAVRQAAVAFLILYVLCMPAVACTTLLLQRRRGLAMDTSPLGFLVEGIKSRWWFWEGSVLARRVLFALLLAVRPSDTAALPLLFMFVLLISAVVHRQIMPYELSIDNTAEYMSLLALVITYASVVAMFSERIGDTTALAVVMVILNIGVVCFMVWVIISRARQQRGTGSESTDPPGALEMGATKGTHYARMDGDE